MNRSALACGVVLLLVGCRDRSAAPPAREREATASTGAGSADLTEQMRHCPVTVPGIETGVMDVEGGVAWTLVVAPAAAGTGPAGTGSAGAGAASAPVVEVRARAGRLAEMTAGRAARGAHGGGRGGGFMRNCPIVTKDAVITAEDVEGGVRVVVRSRDPGPAAVAALRAMTRERLQRTPLARAAVVRLEASDRGEVRLLAGAAADLDGDGTLELLAGGFSEVEGGRRSTILVYRQRGDAWVPLTETGWDGGDGSMVRNVEIADVDGDGGLEVMALGRVGTAPHTARARLAVFALRDGALVERAAVEWLDGAYTHGYGLAAGDLDADARAEIVTGGFQFDGTLETGFVRVWSLADGALRLRARAVLDGGGAPSMRVNDLAIAELDGDGRPDIVVVGRHGALKSERLRGRLDLRRETGDVSILGLVGDQLAVRARTVWKKGPSLRLRSVVVVAGGGGEAPAIVVGGQYDTDGKVALGLFTLGAGQLTLRDDASSTTEGVTGELKDLVVAGTGAAARILATGVIGDRPGRQGDVGVWRLDGERLVRDAQVVSRNGDETRARAVVVVPGARDGAVLTIGHARNDAHLVGQVLSWTVGAPAAR